MQYLALFLTVVRYTRLATDAETPTHTNTHSYIYIYIDTYVRTCSWPQNVIVRTATVAVAAAVAVAVAATEGDRKGRGKGKGKSSGTVANIGNSVGQHVNLSARFVWSPAKRLDRRQDM